MATSQQPMPQGTPFPVKFNTSINLDNVNENVYGFDDGTAPALTNTGILRDDGVTNLYETTSTSSFSNTFYAPNGKKIELSYSDQIAYVDGSKVGNIGPYGESNRVSAPLGAIDMAVTSTNTWLLLNKSTNVGFGVSGISGTPAPASGWISVAYGNGVWIAVAQTTSTTQAVMRSTDNGATWSAITGTPAPGGVWLSVAYGNGVWIAVAYTTSTTQAVMRSTDNGATWSIVTGTPAPAFGWDSVAYGNGVFVAVANTTSTTQAVMRSTDNGVSWSIVTGTPAPASNWFSVSYGNGVWIAVAQTTSTTQAVMRSTNDGATWSAVTGTPAPASGWYSVAYGNGVWIALDNSTSTTQAVMRSTDNGATWSIVTGTPAPASGWISVAYGNGVWIAVANTTSTTAAVMRSIDNGVTWSAFTGTPAPASGWISVAYGNGVFVAVAPTTSTTAAVMRFANAPLRSYIVREYNPVTNTVINTTTLTTVVNNVPDYACLVKSHQMTFATADVAYIYFSGSTVTCSVFVSSVSKSIFSAAGKPYNYTGISAFKNGGTYVVGGVPTTANMPQTYSLPTPYTTPALVGTECSYLANYEEFNTSASLALNLIATPSNLSSANWTTFGTKVVISTLGVVTATTITQAGLTIFAADTYSGFGWSSGRYKSTAATKLSPFILNGAGTPVTITETVTDYGQKPIPVCSFGLTTDQKAYLYCAPPSATLAGSTGANARPAQVVWGGTVGAMPLVEYGNVSPASPVCQFLNSSGVYIVTVPGPQFSPGTGTITVSTIGANTYQMKPISKDVVAFTDSYGTIINTVTGITEVNQGSMCPGFVSDIYLTGTNLVSYQTIAKYSNAVDLGTNTLVVGPTKTSSMTATSITGAVLLPVVFYVGASAPLYAVGLLSGGSQVATDTTVAYSANSNLPPPVDAIYSGGGVQLLGSSALQTIGEVDADGFSQYYAGYTLANQLPVSYQFFNLFGQIYGFDGQKIFRVPVSGATVGTPEQVALASGLTFIANSPTVAWFYSSFDNCLYVFTGGQKVDKWQEMTGTVATTSGSYSVRENTLYLQLSDSTTLMFRDNFANIMTNAYPTQTIYTTDTGTYFVNTVTPSLSKLWTYYSGSGTPITVTWQSGFYGLGRNQYCRITQAVITVKVTDATTTAITINYKWVTANDSGIETATYAANTYQVSTTGYARFQYNPTQSLVYGASIGVSFSKKAILYDAVMYYTDGGVAPVPNRLP
jgi:hypothetical protein